MAHQEQGPLVFQQKLFQELDGLDVEVVGRLVHHQEIGRAGEELRQEQPVPLAARETFTFASRAVGRKEEVLQIADDVALPAVEDEMSLPSVTFSAPSAPRPGGSRSWSK